MQTYISCYVLDKGSDETFIPEETILYLCNEFSTKSACILMLATSVTPELEEVMKSSCFVRDCREILINVYNEKSNCKPPREPLLLIFFEELSTI